MVKTVSQLTPEELKQYDPTRNLGKALDPARWEKAQSRLPQLAALLREQFGASRVKVFGSLVDKHRYTKWSDIDLAVWGILPELYLKAVGAVNDLSVDIEVDLVEPEQCRSLTLKQIIAEEGVEI